MTQEFVTLPREVVERALEALKYEKDANNPLDWHHDKTMNALRAALEQPQGEQEPVAWCELDADRRGIAYFDGKPIIMTGPAGNEHHPDPLYTHPQPKTEPLTHQQIDAIAESMPGGLDGFLKGWGWRQFARAVEAAHNIK